jgi:hypothetical protein
MMKREPVKRHGKWIFGALVLGVCAAILSTLLLANDRRNLRTLFDHYGVAWPFDRAAVIVPPADVKRPRPAPQKPIVSVPTRLMDPVAVDQLGGLARSMLISGPALCDLLARGGVDNKGWIVSPYDPQSFECLSEQRLDDPEDAGGFASYFLSIRGRPDGQITAVRMKLVTPETVAGAAMKVKFLQALNILIGASGWQDFGPVVASATRLEEFEATNFGMSLGFKREFTNPRRFNLIIMPSNSEPAIKRTREFFEGSGGLPSAPGGDTLPRLTPVVPPSVH